MDKFRLFRTITFWVHVWINTWHLQLIGGGAVCYMGVDAVAPPTMKLECPIIHSGRRLIVYSICLTFCNLIVVHYFLINVVSFFFLRWNIVPAKLMYKFTCYSQYLREDVTRYITSVLNGSKSPLNALTTNSSNCLHSFLISFNVTGILCKQ